MFFFTQKSIEKFLLIWSIDESGLKSIFIVKFCVVLILCVLINNELTPAKKIKRFDFDKNMSFYTTFINKM
jgi:hypothetical protein